MPVRTAPEQHLPACLFAVITIAIHNNYSEGCDIDPDTLLQGSHSKSCCGKPCIFEQTEPSVTPHLSPSRFCPDIIRAPVAYG
jgi:hypothetical protein